MKFWEQLLLEILLQMKTREHGPEKTVQDENENEVPLIKWLKYSDNDKQIPFTLDILQDTL